MAVYAIGDLQGCYTSFRKLLNAVDFASERDELWLAGDLVNRGPDSLNCLRLAKRLKAKIVLGNHDLHLLACYYSKHLLKKKDTLASLLEAEDCHALMEWLRRQPLIRVDKARHLVMSHAGVPHIWKIKHAIKYANEVHEVLASEDAKRYEAYFNAMYGNQPAVWDDSLKGQDRLRVITNYLTRMRFIDQRGALELSAKEGLDKTPLGFAPWFKQ
ncbi:diadenosine tetraphosphatase, partial [Oleiphilus sp. HI0118]